MSLIVATGRVLALAALLGAAACAPGAASPSAQPAPAAPTAASDPPTPSAGAAPAAATAAAPTAPAAAASAPAPLRLRVATIRITADAGLYIADEKGYFKEQGIDVDWVDFATAAEATAPLGAGQLDIGVGAVGAGLFNAMARGIDIRLVADKAATSPDPRNGFASSLALAVPREYADGGRFTDYADLRGKTIVIPAKGTASHILIDQALRKGGLTLADAEINELTFPDINPALANKAVDVALQIDPLLTLGEAQGILVPWKRAVDIYPGQQIAAIMYGPRVAEIGQNAGNRFMVAYVRGLRDYNDAFGPRRQNRAEVVAILTKNTNVKDAALYDKVTWDYMNPDGYINAETLARDMDWYVANGYLTEKPDVARIVDNSFADYAVRALGKYQP
jgi:NitT/TauT family transport system substrate-binding protein